MLKDTYVENFITFMLGMIFTLGGLVNPMGYILGVLLLIASGILTLTAIIFDLIMLIRNK